MKQVSPLTGEEIARLVVIAVFVLIFFVFFAAIWMAWGVGPALVALVMLAVGIWIGRR